MEQDGSDTDDGMTPPLPVVMGRGKGAESQYSQVEKFLPPPASSSSSSAFRPPVPLSNAKPPAVQKPKVATSSGKILVKASQVTLSVDDLRNQSLRALKKLPTGESPSMWTIMTCLDVTDMKTLCKYCGIHPAAKQTKNDLGQIVLTSFQKGAFRSLFKPPSSSSDAERRVPKPQQAPAATQEAKEQASQPARSTQLPPTGQESQRAMPVPTPLPTPVMTVGSDAHWKPVDNCKKANYYRLHLHLINHTHHEFIPLFPCLPLALKLLLEQEEDVTRVQDGLYIDRADWKECSSELEAIIEGNNPSFAAREMLRALGTSRRPLQPRDTSFSTGAAGMPRDKHRFDAVVKRVQGCVFPELQSLLSKRFACPQMSVSTQTEGSPSGRGDKTGALTTVSILLAHNLSYSP